MSKANSFLLGVLPDIKIMVAERKKVDRLAITQTSTPEGVPLPSYRYGRERVVHHTQNYSSEGKALMRELLFSLSKPAGNVGQQAKDSSQHCCSQAHKMTFALK